MSRAIVIHETGGPEVLKLEERTVADPGPGQLKLRNRAIGINFVDVYQRTGAYKIDLPFVAGGEGAGEVVAVGPGVTDVKVGDRVGYTGPVGAYAEERLLPVERAVKLPDAISFETAAASLLKGGTAQYLLFSTYAVRAGETILVHAAAGGVGSILTQWASSLGVRVIATAGSAEKVALAKAAGADVAIDYSTGDWVKSVRDATGGRGVDVVYDGVGKATFDGSVDSLRPRGMLVNYGSASGPVSIPNLGILATKGSLYVTRPTMGTYHATTEEFRSSMSAVFKAILDGTIKIAIGARWPLAQAAEAHRALEARETTGSLLLIP